MTVLYSQLLGGIGNILFIIANLYSLSLDRNMKYYVTNYTQSCTKRKDEKEWLNTIFKNVNKTNNRPKNIKYIYKERSHKYQKIPNSNKVGLEIYGYFQSEKYFKHNKEKVINLFTSYKKKIQHKLDKIFNYDKKTISLHIRRGDYIKLQHAHVVQDLEYYKKSLLKLSQKLNYKTISDMNKDYRLVIFSDDIKWCKNIELFNLLDNVKFMENNSTIEDLYLMSMCNHHIIANSTFSWWGAYLNNNENKIVISPSKWFNENYMKKEEWQDIYCDDWIIIEQSYYLH